MKYESYHSPSSANGICNSNKRHLHTVDGHDNLIRYKEKKKAIFLSPMTEASIKQEIKRSDVTTQKCHQKLR